MSREEKLIAVATRKRTVDFNIKKRMGSADCRVKHERIAADCRDRMGHDGLPLKTRFAPARGATERQCGRACMQASNADAFLCGVQTFECYTSCALAEGGGLRMREAIRGSLRAIGWGLYEHAGDAPNDGDRREALP